MIKCTTLTAVITTGASASYVITTGCALAFGNVKATTATGYPTGKTIAAITPLYAAGGSGNVYRGIEVCNTTDLSVFGVPNVTYTCYYICFYKG